MGLSKSNRVRNSAAQIGPDELSPSLAYVLRFSTANRTALQTTANTIQQAVRLRVWLEEMQKQLQKTAASLRDNPSSVLSRFQKTFSRPSYFFKSQETQDWVLLLGPHSRTRATAPVVKALAQTAAAPIARPVPGRIFDFV